MKVHTHTLNALYILVNTISSYTNHCHTELRYQGLIILAVTQSALATIITIICRAHIDLLNGKTVVAFAIKNFRYFGLPIELIFLAFTNTIIALELWIFGKYGLIAGAFASVASFGGMWGRLFIWYSVFSWKNKELSKRVRFKRKKLGKEILKNLFPFNCFNAGLHDFIAQFL